MLFAIAMLVAGAAPRQGTIVSVSETTRAGSCVVQVKEGEAVTDYLSTSYCFEKATKPIRFTVRVPTCSTANELGCEVKRTGLRSLFSKAQRLSVIEPLTASTEAACTSLGGQWMGTEDGRGRLTGCNLTTGDAGKTCTDSSTCESVCVKSRCHGFSMFKGCGVMVGGGNVVCID